MTTLETDLLNAWNDTMSELTPEERKILQGATAEDWAKAIAKTVADPAFWVQIATAFVNGFIKGANR